MSDVYTTAETQSWSPHMVSDLAARKSCQTPVMDINKRTINSFINCFFFKPTIAGVVNTMRLSTSSGFLQLSLVVLDIVWSFYLQLRIDCQSIFLRSIIVNFHFIVFRLQYCTKEPSSTYKYDALWFQCFLLTTLSMSRRRLWTPCLP